MSVSSILVLYESLFIYTFFKSLTLLNQDGVTPHLGAILLFFRQLYSKFIRLNEIANLIPGLSLKFHPGLEGKIRMTKKSVCVYDISSSWIKTWLKPFEKCLLHL